MYNKINIIFYIIFAVKEWGVYNIKKVPAQKVMVCFRFVIHKFQFSISLYIYIISISVLYL